MTHGTSPGRPIRIGTRKSELALRQSRMVQAALAERGVASELVTFDTIGDRVLDRPMAAIGEKGLFTAELEAALRAGDVDCCVHSLKDLPTELPADLAVVAQLPREDPRDVLVAGPGVDATSLAALPRGARVGTSSLRRRAQLLAVRPDVSVVDLRGNVPTRLRKVAEGQCDAAILAAAGLLRLGLDAQAAAWLGAPAWLPAPGQGAIAIESRADDPVVRPLLAALAHAPTMLATAAERALLNTLQGGCHVPVGALVLDDAGSLALHGLVADPDGRRVVRGREPVDPTAPARAGERLAAALVAQGAAEILADVRAAPHPAISAP